MSNLSRDTNSLAAGLEMILQERLLSRDDGTALQKYLEEKSGEWSLLKIPYLRQQSSSTPGYVTLKDVFVPLSVYRDAGEKREKFFDFAARNTRFILLGLPGYGKSTSFSRLALALAEGRAQADLGWEDAPPLLPILVSLRSFGVYLASDQNRSKFPEPAAGALVAFLQERVQNDRRIALPPDFFDRRLEEGHCMVLLDALDEASDNRARVAQFIAAFVRKYGAKGNRIGLSSRPKGYDESVRMILQPEGFSLAELTPLSPSGIAHLIENMYRVDADSQKTYQEDSLRLQKRVLADERLTQIARAPLFCVAMVQVQKYHRVELPHRRVDVLKEIVDLLLGYWNIQKETDNLGDAIKDGTGAKYYDLNDSVEAKGRLLAHLAFVMQTQLRSPEITTRQAQDALQAYYVKTEGVDAAEARLRAKGFLEYAHLSSGILLQVNPGVHSFLHKNFMEYFAASAILFNQEDDYDPIQFVLGVLEKDPDWWNEVLAFTGAHPEGKSYHHKWTTALLKDAQNYPPDSPQWVRRLQVAGMIARDQTTRLTPPLREKTRDKLSAAAIRATLSAPARATLADLADELGYQPLDLFEFVEIKPTRSVYAFLATSFALPETAFYMAKYPVTNGQYERFLQAENFARREFWVDLPRFDENGKEMEPSGEAGWKWLQGKLAEAKKEGGGEVLYPRYWQDARLGRSRRNAPVVGVTWYEANAYCKWLSAQSGEAEHASLRGKMGEGSLTFRLPTEAEWVAAALPASSLPAGLVPKGGRWAEREGPYAFGDKAKKELPRYANTSESEIGRTTPVWMYPEGVSEQKVMDLSGNVWEWQANYYSKSRSSFGLRGGSWLDNEYRARVSTRSGGHPDFEWYYGGFRLLLPPHRF